MGFGAIVGAAAGLGASLLGQHQSMSHADFWNRQNIALQKEFAQNSIKWRVEDAKRAGVHPMAALSISPASFSPVSTSIPSSPDYGSYLSDMGQSIDRAIQVGKDDEARKESADQQRVMAGLTVEKAQLENDLLRAEIDAKRAVRNTALPPAAPPVNPKTPSPIGSPTPPVSPNPTGRVSREDAANHVWNMGHGNYAIYWNPNFTQTIGDEAGQVFNIADAAKRAYADGVFLDPESGVTYVYNKDSGWWNRLDSLDSEEARRLLGVGSSGSVPTRSDHALRNRYRYRY